MEDLVEPERWTSEIRQAEIGAEHDSQRQQTEEDPALRVDMISTSTRNSRATPLQARLRCSTLRSAVSCKGKVEKR